MKPAQAPRSSILFIGRRPTAPAGLVGATLAAALTLASGLAHAETTYAVSKSEPKLVVGQSDKLSLTIAGKNGWHLNQEAPVSLTLTPEAGLDIAKTKLARADLALSKPEEIRFDVPVAAREAGAKKVVAEAKFVMCQAEACKPEKETVTLALEVASPAAAKPNARPGKGAKSPKHDATK